MMTRTMIAAMLVGACFGMPKPTRADELVASTSKGRTLLLDIDRPGGLGDEETLAALTRTFAAELYASGYRVLTVQDMRDFVNANQLQAMLGCAESKCMVEIMRDAKDRPDWIAMGSVALVRDRYNISLRLFDTKREALIIKVDSTPESQNIDLALRCTARSLLGTPLTDDCVPARPSLVPPSVLAAVGVGGVVGGLMMQQVAQDSRSPEVYNAGVVVSIASGAVVAGAASWLIYRLAAD